MSEGGSGTQSQRSVARAGLVRNTWDTGGTLYLRIQPLLLLQLLPLLPAQNAFAAASARSRPRLHRPAARSSAPLHLPRSTAPAQLHTPVENSVTVGQVIRLRKHGLFCWLRPCPHQRGYEDTQRHTHTDTQRHRDTHTETHTHRDTHTDPHRDRHTQRHTQRHTHRDTHSHTHTHTHTHTLKSRYRWMILSVT